MASLKSQFNDSVDDAKIMGGGELEVGRWRSRNLANSEVKNVVKRLVTGKEVGWIWGSRLAYGQRSRSLQPS